MISIASHELDCKKNLRSCHHSKLDSPIQLVFKEAVNLLAVLRLIPVSNHRGETPMQLKTLKQLNDVNRAIIKFRGIYSAWSAEHNISYHEMLIFYTIRENIRRSDNARGAYYRSISGHEWGDRRQYDLLVDTSIGAEKAAELIEQYLKMQGKL